MVAIKQLEWQWNAAYKLLDLCGNPSVTARWAVPPPLCKGRRGVGGGMRDTLAGLNSSTRFFIAAFGRMKEKQGIMYFQERKSDGLSPRLGPLV